MKRFLLFTATLFAVIQLVAAPVDLRTAQYTAQNFVNQKLYSGRLNAPLSGPVTLAHVEMNSKMLDRAVYYIFNTSNGYRVMIALSRFWDMVISRLTSTPFLVT